MTATIDTTTTVGELVTQRPSRSRVFEQLGIDYCCGGKKPLDQACTEKGLDAKTVLQVLLAAEATAAGGRDEANWGQARLTDLCNNIEATHHAYLRTELPRLETMTQKVAHAHGPNHPEVIEVARVYAALKAELESHMAKEEQILFPMIRQLEAADDAGQARPGFHCGSLANPIRVMEHEHDNAGAALARMNQLTHGYTAPADACNTFRAMVDALRQLEEDMHVHVHKENSILFPRAVALEQSTR